MIDIEKFYAHVKFKMQQKLTQGNKKREMLYNTRVFYLLAAHEFCVRWMKHGWLVAVRCVPTLASFRCPADQ